MVIEESSFIVKCTNDVAVDSVPLRVIPLLLTTNIFISTSRQSERKLRKYYFFLLRYSIYPIFSLYFCGHKLRKKTSLSENHLISTLVLHNP